MLHLLDGWMDGWMEEEGQMKEESHQHIPSVILPTLCCTVRMGMQQLYAALEPFAPFPMCSSWLLVAATHHRPRLGVPPPLFTTVSR